MVPRRCVVIRDSLLRNLVCHCTTADVLEIELVAFIYVFSGIGFTMCSKSSLVIVAPIRGVICDL